MINYQVLYSVVNRTTETITVYESIEAIKKSKDIRKELKNGDDIFIILPFQKFYSIPYLGGITKGPMGFLKEYPTESTKWRGFFKDRIRRGSL
jgi:hypothetical protein